LKNQLSKEGLAIKKERGALVRRENVWSFYFLEREKPVSFVSPGEGGEAPSLPLLVLVFSLWP
jgi:hypothetical protein